MKKILTVALTLIVGGNLLVAEEPPAKGFARDIEPPEGVILLRADKSAAKRNPLRKPITVLDVRTPEEFASGHLEGAINIDFKHPDFEKQVAQLDKNRPYLVHCGRGTRSAKARDRMKELGFTKIYHLNGGAEGWQKAGGPMVKEDKK
ncbi:MAG: rhodanese-like domain-containing protein [Verrucomicrobiales bacterium]